MPIDVPLAQHNARIHHDAAFAPARRADLIGGSMLIAYFWEDGKESL